LSRGKGFVTRVQARTCDARAVERVSPVNAYPGIRMRRLMIVGATAAAVIAAACSDSATAAKQESPSNWSGAVIEVAASNPNAHGEVKGVVLDSGSKLDPSTAKPIAGATVTLNLKVTVPAGTAGNDTAYTSVTKVGEVTTDANGRFLVTSIPEGDYYIAATSPDAAHYDNATWAFASSGGAEKDAVIYLPIKLGVPPVDSL
jgi:Prealbumin-like fold domain